MTPIGKNLPCSGVSSQRKRKLSRSFDGLFAAVTLVAFTAPSADAASYTWTPTAAGPFNWNNASGQNNWTSGFPNALADVANMSVNLSANQAVNLNQTVTVGSLTIGDNSGAQTVTLAPNSGSLTFDASSGSASLIRSGGGTAASTISAPISLNDNLAVSLASGTASSTMTLSGVISESGGAKTLTKESSTLTLALSGVNSSWTGGIIIKNGTVNGQNNVNSLGTGGVTLGGTGSTGATLTGGQNFSAVNVTVNTPTSGNCVISANGGGSGMVVGSITLNSANLTVETFAAGTTASTTVSGGVTGTGNLVINNQSTTTGKVTLSGANPINNTGTVTSQGVGTTANLISAVMGTNVTGVTQTGPCPLVLSATNLYTGPTTISAGTLTLGKSNVLPDATAVSIGAATLDAATFTDTAGTLDVTASATINLGAGAALAFADSSAIDWTGGTLNITGTFVSGTSLRFGTTSGGLTTAQLGKISVSGSPTFTLNSNGYLVGDTSPPVVNDAVVSFANSGTGFGPTPPYLLSGANAATIKLNFAISGAGVISLDASTTGVTGNDVTEFNAMVNEWDSSNVGTVTNSAWFSKSFTLTGSGSGGGNLSITENGGGGIGIQGENSNCVDGQSYNNSSGVATSTPETLTWTLSGAPAGLALDFKNWAYVEGNGGDIRVSNGTTNADFANMATATGAPSLPADFVLSNGESLTFKEIPGVTATNGAAIAGFSFAVVAVVASEGFDNSAGNNLWTNATNWNPDGVPASPADAIIDRYDVILNTAASTNPDELLISNGSLTVSGTGALSMRAMTIGRDLTKTVSLVIHGSGVSFGYNGSSAADEFAVGSAATVETKIDSSGSEPLELGVAKLVLDTGAQWIVDGTHASGFSYNIGDRLVLANFGSFSGSTNAIRARNFDLPSNRRLELVATPTSIYYEVKAQTAATGPNIIIINTDDQAADQHFGFDGRNCITPTLDSLVSTGLKFNLAFCASSVCGASRYSLLTSRWPSRNTSDTFITRYPLGTLGRFGVSDTELERDGQNIGAWLQKAGYRTGFVGKSHVLDDELNFTTNWPSKGLITYDQADDPATNATVNAAMQHNHRIVCQDMRGLGFDYVDGFYHANLKELYNDKLNVHNQEWITSRALKFIEENRSERFFLYMAPTINHGPVNNNLDYTLRAKKAYTSAGYLPDEDYSFMPTRASILNQVEAANKPLISARETWLDYSVKAILDKLTAYGIRNDTLIIFTSDHGEKTLTTNPTIWGKTSLFDLGLKVPLVMNWPNGIASPGRGYNELVSHVDIGSTLLALAGASNLPTRPMDGVSLVPVFNGSSAAVRSDVFGEIGYARGVRTKTRKYIAVRYTPTIYSQIASGFRWPEYNANSQLTGGTIPRPYYVNNSGLGGGVADSNPTYFDDDQLYNLTSDPNENTNIYGQEPATAYELKKRLASYIGSIPGRPFRQSGDSSAEFAPAPAAAPSSPQALQSQLQGINQVQLNWVDAANNELGYVIRKSVNGAKFQIIDEKPAGVTTSSVPVDAGVEDIVLQVSAYNSQGDTGAASPVDLLSPDSWRYRTFGPVDPNLIAPSSQWSADADGDGQTNLWEYAFGTDPRLTSSVARCEQGISTVGEDSFLEYRVPRDSRRNVQISGSVSENLSSWSTGAPACVVAEDQPAHLLFRSAVPVNGRPRQFIRAEIAVP